MLTRSNRLHMHDKQLKMILMTILLLLSTFVASGCKPSAAPEKKTEKESKSEGKKKAAIPVANPAYPGDYKVVEEEGIEYLQGRFPKGEFGGTLVRPNIGADPKTFNYWAAADTKSKEMAALMFASLTTTDKYSGDVIPYLASSIKVEDDGLTYYTTLRKGLTWSDGKPITSADVEFTWNTIVSGGYGNASLRDVTTVDGKSPVVTSVDKLTNKYVTAKKFAPFKRVIGEIPLAPKHIVEKIIKSKNGRKKFQGLWGVTLKPSKLVTSGPFTLERFVPSQRIEFKRSKNFAMLNQDGKQLPYLDKIIYLSIPDVQTNLLKFKGKETDITQIRSRDTFEMMKERESGNFSLHNLGQSTGSVFLSFNLNRRSDPKTKKPYVDPVKSKWFNDINFRQAVNHVLNRENMVANYFKGLGYPSFSTISPNSPFFNNKLKGFKPDLEYAMSLLEKSGFKKNEDGNLLDKDGNIVEFDMVITTGGTFIPSVANMAIDDMKKLGIKVNLQEINFNIMIDKVMTSMDWQSTIFALSGGDPFEPNSSANVFRSDSRLHLFDQRKQDKNGKTVVTDARDWEKRLDTIFSVAAQTMEKPKRKELYDEFQKIIYDEAPMIYLCNAMNIVAARNSIQNYQPTQLSQLEVGLHNIEEIWMKESQEKNIESENNSK